MGFKNKSASGTVIGEVQEHKVTLSIPSPVVKSHEDALTDEYLDLKAKFEAMDGPKIVARMEVIKKELQSIANASIAAESEAIFETPMGSVMFSPRAGSRTITNPERLLGLMISKVGMGGTAQLITIPLGSVDKVFLPHEIEDCVVTEYGSRRLVGAKPKG